MPEISRADVQAGIAAEGDEAPNQPAEKGTETPKFFNPKAPPPGAEPAVTEPSKQPTGAPEPEGQPAAPPDDEYVYPDDPSIPEMLRGKKASEAARAYQMLFDTSRSMAQYLQNAPAAPTGPAPAAPAGEPEDSIFAADDFVTGDPRVIEQKLDQFFTRKATPLLNDVYKGLTIQTMHTAESTLPHYKKYKEEIHRELARVPINLTAQYATWKDAHDRVVARHIDEIAAERTRNRPAPPPTERGGHQPTASTASTVELSADDIKIADGLGVDRATFARMKALYVGAEGRV